MKEFMLAPHHVHFGCGFCAPAGWLNYDSSLTLRVERIPLIGRIISGLYSGNPIRFPTNVQYGDIVKGLPLPDSCCKAVYCSHVLSMLCLEDFRKAVINTRRLLCKGGIFRFVDEDLECHIKHYEMSMAYDRALNFMKSTHFGCTSRPRGLAGFVRVYLGNSQRLWMWDYHSIKQELLDAGFTDIRRATFNDSSDSMFLTVEQPLRWHDCLGIECVAQ